MSIRKSLTTSRFFKGSVINSPKEKTMKRTVRALLTLSLCLTMMPAVYAKKRPAVSVTGVYENFTVGQGSGDLEGMRVVIVQAGGGHHAIVQVAQGGAEDPQPEFVEVKVKGRSVSFTAGSLNYTGTVSATGLRLKSDGEPAQVLKRKPCSSYL
jgi:hypothetical protein